MVKLIMKKNYCILNENNYKNMVIIKQTLIRHHTTFLSSGKWITMKMLKQGSKYQLALHVVKLRCQIIPEATINLCNRSRGQIKGAGSKGNALTSLLSNYYQKFNNSKQWLFRKLNTLIFGMLSMVMKRPDKYCG